MAGSSGSGSGIGTSSVAANAVGTGAAAFPVILPEAPWLQERTEEQKETVPLRDLLVSRLELSLWVAFWRRVHRCPAPAPRVSAGLKGVTEQTKHLQAFVAKLQPAEQAALFEGLRPAQHVLLQLPGEEEERVKRPHKKKEKQEGLECARESRAQAMMERLLLMPVHWVYQDEGKAVRRVLERVQAACADSVARELLDDHERGSISSTCTSAWGACTAGKKKKKQQQQRLKELQRLEKQLRAEAEASIVVAARDAKKNGLNEGGRKAEEEEEEESILAVRIPPSLSALKMPIAEKSGQSATGLLMATVMEEGKEDDGSWEEVGPRGVVVKRPLLASTLVPPALEAFPPLRLPTPPLSGKATADEKTWKKGGQEASPMPLSPAASPFPSALMEAQSTGIAVAKEQEKAVRSGGEDEKAVEPAAMQGNSANGEAAGIEAAKKKKKKKKKAAVVKGVEGGKQEEAGMSTTLVLGGEKVMVVVKEPAAGGVAAVAGAGAASALFPTSPSLLSPPLTSSVFMPVAPSPPPAPDPLKISPITTISTSSITDSMRARVPAVASPTAVSISSTTSLAMGPAELALPPSAPLCSIVGGGKKKTEWEGRGKDRQQHQCPEGGRGAAEAAAAAVAVVGRATGAGGDEVGDGWVGLVAPKPAEVPGIVVGEDLKRPKSKIRSQYKKRRKMREVIAAIMAGVLDRVDLVVSGAQPLPAEVEGPPATTKTTTTTTMAREEMVKEKVKQGPSQLQQSQEQPQSVQENMKTEERPLQAPVHPQSMHEKETEQRPTRAQQQQQKQQLKLQGEMQVQQQQQKQQQPQPRPQPQQMAAQQGGDVQEISKATNANANPKPIKQQQQQQQQQLESPSARLVSPSSQKQNPSLTSSSSFPSSSSSSSYGNGTNVQAAPQKQVQHLTKKQRQQEQQLQKKKLQLQDHQQLQQQQQQQKQQQVNVKSLSAYAQPQLAAKQKYNSKDAGSRSSTITNSSITSSSVAINAGRPPLQLGSQYAQPIYHTQGVGRPAGTGRGGGGGGEGGGGGGGGRASAGGQVFQSTRQPLYSRLHQQHHTPQYYQEYPRAHRGGTEAGGSMVGGGGSGRRGRVQRLDGRREWGESGGHHVPYRHSAVLIPQVPLHDCLHRQQRHEHHHPQQQHQQRAPHRHVGGDGGRSGSSAMNGGVYESVMPPPLVMQQAHEVYALDLEAEKARHAYCQGIDAMRALLTDNIATFMAKREADMKTHRAAREGVLGEMRTIIQGLWSGARVELYGSCFTGLDLVSSDVDIVVCGLSLTGSTANATPQITRQLEQQHNESTASSSPDGGHSVATTISSASGSSSRASTTVATGPSSAASSVVDEEEEETDNHSHSQLSDTSSSSTATRSTPAGSRSPALSSPASSPRLGPAASAPTSSIMSTSATPPRSLPPGHGESTRLLYQLAAALEGRPWVRSLKTIDTAFIPVIKILADPAVLMGVPDSLPTPATALVPVDISLEGRQHGGIASSLLIRDLVAPGRPYAHAVPLTLVLKALMTQRGLNQPWCGGVSSYALMLMVIAVLQQFETPEVAQANVLAMARSVDTIKRRAIPPVLSCSSSCNAGCRGSGESGSGGSDIRSKGGTTSVPAVRDEKSRRLHSPDSPVPEHMDYGKALRGGSGHLEEAVVTPATTLEEVKPPPPLVTGGYGSPAEISYRLWSQFAAAQTASDGGMEDRHDGGGGVGVGAGGNPEKEGMSSGFLLTYFLEYYGRIFNPQVEGIAVDQGYGLTFPLADFFQAHGLPVVADPLTILDPLDRAVNVSRCAFRIGEIQVLFQQCLASLEAHGTEMGRSILHAPPAEDGWSHVGGAGSGGKKKKSKKGASGGGQWQGQSPVDPVPLPPTENVLSLMLSY